MCIRIRVAAVASMIALGTVLAAPACAQDDSTTHRHVRAPDQERSYTPRMQRTSTTSIFNTFGSAMILPPVADSQASTLPAGTSVQRDGGHRHS
jgi:hypothetical protein